MAGATNPGNIGHAWVKALWVDRVPAPGMDRPDQYEHYFKVMADAAAYAKERKIKLVMKPHGGSSGASEEILRCIEKVNHPNFKIWYDAGNIIYYTGKDPFTGAPVAVSYKLSDTRRQKELIMWWVREQTGHRRRF